MRTMSGIMSGLMVLLLAGGLLLIDGCTSGEAENLADNSYDLDVEGTGFSAHNDRFIEVAVRDAQSGEVVGIGRAKVKDGSFEVEFDDILDSGRVYTIDYFADVNGNGLCDSPPVDEAWRVSLSPVNDDTDVEILGSIVQDGVACLAFQEGPFDLRFHGDDLSGFEDDEVYVALLDRDSGSIIAVEETDVEDGRFRVEFENALFRGGRYFIDVHIDINDNEECEAPPTDRIWRYELLPVTSDLDLALDPDEEAFPNACRTFNENVFDGDDDDDDDFNTQDLDFEMDGVAFLEGSVFRFALIDNTTGNIVDSASFVIDDDDIEFEIDEILIEGRSYTLDITIDINGNGVCDPDIDNAARIEIGTVTDGVDINIDYEDIMDEDACATFN